MFQNLDNPTGPVATGGDSMESTDGESTDPLPMDVVPGKLAGTFSRYFIGLACYH